jgi:DNA-binding GntR family transcriptional regulator
VSVPFISQPDLGDRVYEVVYEQIMTSALLPGSELSLTRLAREMGVSLTPVRDALNRLAAEKLVVEVPRKGYFVAKLEPQDIADLMEARLIVELAAVERGVDRASAEEVAEMQRLVAEMANLRQRDYLEYAKVDYTFHQLIVGTAKNRQLVEIHRTLGIHVYAHRIALRANATEKRASTAVQEHQAIAQGFVSRDLAILKATVTQHIESSTRLLLASSGEPI